MHEHATLSTAGLFFTSLLSLVSLHASVRPTFSEPLCVHDGGHMTKGAAPGHVCISAALPGTVTDQDACHVTPDDRNTPDFSD